jgi:hypothetical protein
LPPPPLTVSLPSSARMTSADSVPLSWSGPAVPLMRCAVATAASINASAATSAIAIDLLLKRTSLEFAVRILLRAGQVAVPWA